MKVHVAEEAGFCFGVRSALEILDELCEKNKHIQVLGQLIHNQTTLQNLEKKGIKTIHSLEQVDGQSTLVIRTHGIPRESEARLIQQHVDYVDATCPLVKKLHQLAAEYTSRYQETQEEFCIIIVGDKNHPEIIAAASYAGNVTVIESEAEARQIPYCEHMAVMAQTTLDADHFNTIVSLLEGKTKHLKVFNTICRATRVRQEAVKKLAPCVDAMVVVGGKNSSNTRKLYHIARERNQNTFFIESHEELIAPDSQVTLQVSQFQSVGIAAGASTPPDEIEKIKVFFNNINSNRVKEMNHGRSKRNPAH